MTRLRSRIARLGLALACPLLLAAECNEPSLTLSNLHLWSHLGAPTRGVVTVLNGGGGDATLGTISTAALGLAAPFSVVGGTCTTGVVLPRSGGTCTIEISFLPAQLELYTDTLELRYGWSDSGDSRVALQPIEGSGGDPINISTSGELENRPPGTTSQQTITLNNRGGYALKLGSISDSALGLAAPFSLAAGSCPSGAVLMPGAACPLIIRFTPTEVGRFHDPFQVEYSWSNGSVQGTYVRSLDVVGSSTPAVTSAGIHYFAPVLVGAQPVATITVANAGPESVTLGTVTAAGLGLAPPFSLASASCTSGQVLAPQSSCTIAVRFTASSTGTSSDELTLSYHWPGVPTPLVVQHALVATAVAPQGSDCFQSGCAAGEVCAQLTTSGAGPGTCVPVPDPPADCMAPCLWEARKKCLPILNACSTERIVTNPPFEDELTSCDATSGWAMQEDRYDWIVHRTEYRHAGAACFVEDSNQTDLNTFHLTYTDGANPLATGIYYNHMLFEPMRQIVCADDPTRSHLEKLRAPQCASWRGTYLGKTSCRSTTAGSCSGL